MSTYNPPQKYRLLKDLMPLSDESIMRFTSIKAGYVGTKQHFIDAFGVPEYIWKYEKVLSCWFEPVEERVEVRTGRLDRSILLKKGVPTNYWTEEEIKDIEALLNRETFTKNSKEIVDYGLYCASLGRQAKLIPTFEWWLSKLCKTCNGSGKNQYQPHRAEYPNCPDCNGRGLEKE